MNTVGEIRVAIEGLPDHADICLEIVDHADNDETFVGLLGFRWDEGRLVISLETDSLDCDEDFEEVDDYEHDD